MHNLQELKEELIHKIEQVASKPEHNDTQEFLNKQLELLKFIEKQCLMLTGERY